MLAIDESLYPSIEGTTDSETMFYLALTFGSRAIPSLPWSAWSASSRKQAVLATSRNPCR